MACKAPLSMGFSRKEHWSGLPCPPPGDLPHPGIKSLSPASPALAGGFFTGFFTRHHLVFFQSYTTLNFMAYKNRGYSGVTVKSSSLFALTTSPWYIAGPSSLYSVCFRVTVEYLGLKFSLHFYAVHRACPITVLITQRHSLLVEHLIPWPFHI